MDMDDPIILNTFFTFFKRLFRAFLTLFKQEFPHFYKWWEHVTIDQVFFDSSLNLNNKRVLHTSSGGRSPFSEKYEKQKHSRV
ncbi:hypothetical protein ATHSA_p20029 (plasmid) [Athalassotoga saccharophila]|uniref:Uncharacterized protein n=1 Tax=Athalassotoga saccharophila TaxID=1441386 RepID=A0A6N4TEB7_9BACT|nr:hypothetical protein ATHSA_p20029 [Athalassotoga saccharophila]